VKQSGPRRGSRRVLLNVDLAVRALCGVMMVRTSVVSRDGSSLATAAQRVE